MRIKSHNIKTFDIHIIVIFKIIKLQVFKDL